MRVISFAELKAAKGIPFSGVWIRKLIADGKFPKPITLSDNRVAFLENEIDAWLAERVAERSA
jgi:prophage regulatory protein